MSFIIKNGIKYSGAEKNINFSTAPIGVIFQFAGNKVPRDFLLCNGNSFSKEEYPELYAVLGSETLPLHTNSTKLGFSIIKVSDSGNSFALSHAFSGKTSDMKLESDNKSFTFNLKTIDGKIMNVSFSEDGIYFSDNNNKSWEIMIGEATN